MISSTFAIAALVWAIPSTVTAFTTTGPKVAVFLYDEGTCQDGKQGDDNHSHDGNDQNSDSRCPTSTVNSESINTTTGPCFDNSAGGCGAAVYTGSGFSGTVSYRNPGGLSRMADFLCVHTPASSAFVSLGGGYTLTARGSGGALLATSSYSVTGDVDCGGDANPVSGSVQSFTVPADGLVSYSVTVSGFTTSKCPASLSAYNSIRNQVFDLASGAHATSPSVAPCGAPPLVPEAPFSVLLVATAGLVAFLFVGRRSGFDSIRRHLPRSATRGL
jgi:hypothetical protein